MTVTLRLGFGTNSVRALLVRCESGQEIGNQARCNDLYYSLAQGLGTA